MGLDRVMAKKETQAEKRARIRARAKEMFSELDEEVSRIDSLNRSGGSWRDEIPDLDMVKLSRAKAKRDSVGALLDRTPKPKVHIPKATKEVVKKGAGKVDSSRTDSLRLAQPSPVAPKPPMEKRVILGTLKQGVAYDKSGAPMVSGTDSKEELETLHKLVAARRKVSKLPPQLKAAFVGKIDSLSKRLKEIRQGNGKK